MEALASFLSCVWIVSLTSVIHTKLVGSRYEGYLRLLSALILLTLLVSPARALLNLPGDLAGALEPVELPTAKVDPEQLLLDDVEGRLERMIQSELSDWLDLPEEKIRLSMTLDTSDPTAIRVSLVRVCLEGDESKIDRATLEQRLSDRYGCDRVEVSVVA